MAIENVNEIKEYIESNKDNEEVVGLINSYKTPLSIESVMEFCTTEKAGKSYIDSVCDKYSEKAKKTAVDNALEKYKNEEVPKLVQVELNKLNNNNKTPEQIEIEELKSWKIQAEKDKARADLSNKFVKELNTQGIDLEWMDFVIGKDEESTSSNLQKLVGLLNKTTENKVKEKLGDYTYVPKDTTKNNGEVTLQQFKKMGVMDRTKLKNTNIELYNKLMSQIL